MENKKISLCDLLKYKPFMDENDNICIIIDNKKYITKMNEEGEICLYELHTRV